MAVVCRTQCGDTRLSLSEGQPALAVHALRARREATPERVIGCP